LDKRLRRDLEEGILRKDSSGSGRNLKTMRMSFEGLEGLRSSLDQLDRLASKSNEIHSNPPPTFHNNSASSFINLPPKHAPKPNCLSTTTSSECD
jgi:hypothetical protein